MPIFTEKTMNVQMTSDEIAQRVKDALDVIVTPNEVDDVTRYLLRNGVREIPIDDLLLEIAVNHYEV